MINPTRKPVEAQPGRPVGKPAATYYIPKHARSVHATYHIFLFQKFHRNNTVLLGQLILSLLT